MDVEIEATSVDALTRRMSRALQQPRVFAEGVKAYVYLRMATILLNRLAKDGHTRDTNDRGGADEQQKLAELAALLGETLTLADSIRQRIDAAGDTFPRILKSAFLDFRDRLEDVHEAYCIALDPGFSAELRACVDEIHQSLQEDPDPSSTNWRDKLASL